MTAVYDTIGRTYSRYRRPEPRIAAMIEAALGDAASVLSVGGGAGSYEPATCRIAIDPSITMLRQRGPGEAPAALGVAGSLPFADGAFDAALAVLTVHHWPDAAAGLAEMQRVAARQVVLTWDPAIGARFWLRAEYLPEIDANEAGIASLDAVRAGLRSDDVRIVPVPHDCSDGFLGAYWRRPERYLDAQARGAISALASLPAAVVERAMSQLARDLDDGAWHARHADLLERDEIDLGYRLVVGGGDA